MMTEPWAGTPFEAEYHWLHDEVSRLRAELAAWQDVAFKGCGQMSPAGLKNALRETECWRVALALVSGALMDSGEVVPEPSKYGEAIRGITRHAEERAAKAEAARSEACEGESARACERDEALSDAKALREALRGLR